MTNQRQTPILGPVGRFFFSPTDPTGLGFMRVIAGLVVLYTHAAYTPDLREFMGPNAWWDHKAGNYQRRTAPYIQTPLGWKEVHPTVRVEDVPHRRAAVVEFLRGLPADPAGRKASLRYLDTLIRMTERADEVGAREYQAGLELVNKAARLLTDEQEEKVRAALAREPFDDAQSPVHFPGFVRNIPPRDRETLWRDVLAFGLTLSPDDPEKQDYVLHWLATYPWNRRADLYRFLVGEKRDEDGRDMSLPADPAERGAFLDYLETWGGDPRQASDRGTAVFSYWFHLTDQATMYTVHAAFLAVCVLFTLGLFTRVTSVLTWAGSLCYLHRGQVTLFGQDTMQTILLTYLMIGPSGAAVSLDALRLRYRAARALMGSGGTAVPWAAAALAGPARTWLANFAVRLLQINFCLIYASSGVSKLKGTTWWEHSAAWLVLANPEFGLVRYPAFDSLLRTLVDSRVLIGILAGGVTLFTLVVELGFPFLVWTRLRPVMVVLSILLHFGIAIMMGLTVFGLYMFALVLCYFPARLIRERVCVTPGGGRKLTLRYDGADPAAVRAAARVRALDLAGQVTFVDTAGKAKGVHLTDPDGKEHTGRDLARTALRELSLLKPVRFLAAVV